MARGLPWGCLAAYRVSPWGTIGREWTWGVREDASVLSGTS